MPLLSSDTSLLPQSNAILNDHQVDDLPTGDTAPATNTLMPAASRSNEEIHRTHEAVASMTSHPIIAPIKTGTVPSYDIHIVIHRSCVIYYRPHEAIYTIATLSSDWSTSPICENSTCLTRKRRPPWRTTTCVKSSLI
jgi:hypothetical protein